MFEGYVSSKILLNQLFNKKIEKGLYCCELIINLDMYPILVTSEGIELKSREDCTDYYMSHLTELSIKIGDNEIKECLTGLNSNGISLKESFHYAIFGDYSSKNKIDLYYLDENEFIEFAGEVGIYSLF